MRFPSLAAPRHGIYGVLHNGQKFRPCIFHLCLDFSFVNFRVSDDVSLIFRELEMSLVINFGVGFDNVDTYCS